MKHIKINSIEAEANPGAVVYDVIMEAIKMAVDENRNVNVTHNGKTYTVDIKSLHMVVWETEK